MELAERETIVEALDYVNDDYRCRDDYSGRGMYGVTTLAIVHPLPLSSLLYEFTSFLEDTNYVEPDEELIVRRGLSALGKCKCDNMGLQYIIY